MRLNASLFTVIATVLTACGIETYNLPATVSIHFGVATVLTACGIETYTVSPVTNPVFPAGCNSTYRLRY